jgi:hypothetical protein
MPELSVLLLAVRLDRTSFPSLATERVLIK